MEEEFSATPVDVQSAQSQVVHVASKANRMLNVTIDMVLCILAGVAATTLLARIPGLAWLDPEVLILKQSNSLRTQLVLIGFTLPYYFLFEYYLGKTPGKFITRTRVIRIEDGEPPRAWQILLRTLLRNMPLEFLWYLFATVGPHDFMSQTLVVEDEGVSESVEN